MQTKAEDWGTHMTDSIPALPHPLPTMSNLAIGNYEKAVEVELPHRVTTAYPFDRTHNR